MHEQRIPLCQRQTRTLEELLSDPVTALRVLPHGPTYRLFVEERRNKNRTYINETPLWGGQVELFSGCVLRLGLTRLLACGRAGDQQKACICSSGLDAFLHAAIDEVYGNQAQAAEMLGIAPATLSRWYREHRFERRAPTTGKEGSKE